MFLSNGTTGGGHVFFFGYSACISLLWNLINLHISKLLLRHHKLRVNHINSHNARGILLLFLEHLVAAAKDGLVQLQQ